MRYASKMHSPTAMSTRVLVQSGILNCGRCRRCVRGIDLRFRDALDILAFAGAMHCHSAAFVHGLALVKESAGANCHAVAEAEGPSGSVTAGAANIPL